jgi:hypothetical protein
MVYAVGMQIISVFEGAVGRLVQWAPEEVNQDEYKFVQRLKLLPHGIPAPNAFYSPSDRAIYFGYFKATNLTGSVWTDVCSTVARHCRA